jgi:hypothetical protein
VTRLADAAATGQLGAQQRDDLLALMATAQWTRLADRLDRIVQPQAA